MASESNEFDITEEANVPEQVDTTEEANATEKYECKRCGYCTNTKGNLITHLNRKFKCNPKDNESDISCATLLKEFEKKGDFTCHLCHKLFLHRTSHYRHERQCLQKASTKQNDIEVMKRDVVEMKNTLQVITSKANNNYISDAMKNQFQKLQNQIHFLKSKRSEEFYQAIVEEYLKGGHKKLKHCITDVTTDRVNAEVKVWDSFMEAIGQLTYYNWIDPKEELHVYFFGPTQSKDTSFIINHLISNGYHVHTFVDCDDGIFVFNHNTKTNVFKKIFC